MFEDKDLKRSEISEIGEFGLIDKLTNKFPTHNKSTKKTIGDDAAILQYGKEEQTLISTDMLLEGVHFDLSWMELKLLGYKAVAVNLSDIAAMNAIPEQILVSIGISNRFSLEAVEELYEGIYLACQKYKVDLIGGDTTSSMSGLVISITVLGKAEKGKAVCRDGAKENDLVCISGDLGGAYAGLLVLQREKNTFEANPNFQPDLQGYEYVIGRQLKPEPRTDIVNILHKENITPSSMIDISDGLASELFHICKNSNTGCNIYEDKIPIDVETVRVAEEFNIHQLVPALNGGEDYELLFTISMSDYDKIKNIKEIHVIGHICDKNSGLNLINNAGQVIPLQAQGWDSFRK